MGAKDEKTRQQLDACCIDCPARAERTVSISGLCGLFRAVFVIFGTDVWFFGSDNASTAVGFPIWSVDRSNETAGICFADLAEVICPADSIAENKKDHHAVSEHGKSGIALLFLQPENVWNGAAKSGDAVTAAAGNAESLEYPK